MSMTRLKLSSIVVDILLLVQSSSRPTFFFVSESSPLRTPKPRKGKSRDGTFAVFFSSFLHSSSLFFHSVVSITVMFVYALPALMLCVVRVFVVS